MEVAKRALLQPALVLLWLLFTSNAALGAVVNATFELRPSDGQASTVAIGDQLNLDVFLTLSSGSSFSNVKGISFYLHVPAGAQVVRFESFVNDSGLDSSMPAGTDRQPDPGDFARQLTSLPPPFGPGITIPFPNGTAKKVGHFTVTALSEGTVNYAFGTARSGLQPTYVSLGVSDTVSYQTPIVSTFTVTPEPATAAGVLLGCATWLRHRRRR